MTLTISPLSPAFAARVSGAQLRTISDADFAVLRAALDDHGVLVFSGQPFDDESQVAFSERFGPIERVISANPAKGTAFARQSNLDINDGTRIPKDDRRMAYQLGNMQWHADSTFKAVRSLCSILSARIVPPTGGDTEFVSTPNAFRALPAKRQAELDSLEVEHDLIFSRRRVGFEFTDKERAETPPVRHPLVITNPRTGIKSLLIGAHAARIVGWDEQRSRALLDELLDLATQEVFTHQWKADDLIIWDNRAVLHRATPYDAEQHARLMQRTTVSDPICVAEAAS